MPFSKKGKTLSRVTFFLTLSSMKKNRKLNFLVIGVLAFSFLNIVFFESVNNGMADAINQQLIDYTSGHIVVDPPPDERFLDDWKSLRDKLLVFPQVEAVTAEITSYAELQNQDNFRNTFIRAINPENAVEVKRVQDKIVAGRFLEENDDFHIVLGSDVAGGRYEQDSILPGKRIEADVNDEILVKFGENEPKEFKVVGIYRTKFLGLDAEAVIPLHVLQEEAGLGNKVSQVIVRLYDKDQSSKMKNDIINSGVQGEVSGWEENAGFSRSITKSLGMVSQITKVIGLLTAFVTVFIVIFIKTRNQRGQIATLRAVGVSDKAIMGSYLLEAFLLGVVGVFIGVVVMKFIVFYFSGSPLELPIGSVVPILTSETQFNSALLLLLSALFAGFYPTRRVLKENIIEAIRGGPA